MVPAYWDLSGGIAGIHMTAIECELTVPEIIRIRGLVSRAML